MMLTLRLRGRWTFLLTLKRGRLLRFIWQRENVPSYVTAHVGLWWRWLRKAVNG